jgi:hypothetical protein
MSIYIECGDVLKPSGAMQNAEFGDVFKPSGAIKNDYFLNFRHYRAL